MRHSHDAVAAAGRPLALKGLTRGSADSSPVTTLAQRPRLRGAQVQKGAA